MKETYAMVKVKLDRLNDSILFRECKLKDIQEELQVMKATKIKLERKLSGYVVEGEWVNQ